MAKIDDSVKKKVPELRFKGFTDDWEERKFADFIDVKSGKDYKHLNSGPIPVYGTGGYMLSVDRALSDIDAIGIGRKGTIDKPYLLKAPFWTVDTLFYAVPKQNIDLQFSLSIFKKINWKKFDESTGVPSLSKTVINSVGASVPCYEEQQKIGSFFKQLDKTIALHQRKLDLLKEQKKGYLQKMFPKNGAKVPELRFAGFADDWEERKLGNLSQDTIGGGTPKTSVTEYWNGEIPWIQSSDLANDKLYGVLPKKFITEDAVKNSATKLIPANSIAIVTRVGVGKLAFMPYEFASSQDFLSLSNLQVDCNFGMYSIYKMLQRELNNIQGTSIKGITKADLLDKETFVPIKVEEQQKIGSFFKQLDDIIDLHQRRLDLLKEQKKGFLQKMFI
ncbi:restriction endonuclease subunit S [Lactococcus garvieae]|uniref:restriction endonuclease subunit S n=1 Tax=Lactococcus garvieae TaxID=1363 RepID=UPI002097F2EE|nr:restriction endonuclease subunit S [Lactococcus garvieae]MCO7130336.1 restriction endonuclease subunit S [Lactococcus garvieae]